MTMLVYTNTFQGSIGISKLYMYTFKCKTTNETRIK